MKLKNDILYIQINNKIKPFFAKQFGMLFEYNLFSERYDNNSGSIIFNDLFFYLKEEVNEIRLMYNNLILEIDFISSKYYFTDTLNIVLTVKDVFNSYMQVMEFFKQIDLSKRKLYYCFNLSEKCNLRCPYCCQGDQNKKMSEPDFNIANYFIEQVIGINRNTVPNDYREGIRLMGGETFLNVDKFIQNTEYGLSKLKRKDFVHFFSNFTINIDKAIPYLLDLNDRYKDMKIIGTISCDSINHKNSLRIPNERLMNKHKEFIKQFCSIENKNIIKSCNIVHISENDSEELLKFLKSSGIQDYEIVLDETKMRFEELKEHRKYIKKIHKRMDKVGVRPYRQNYSYLFKCFFNINNLDQTIFISKIHFKLKYKAFPFLDY